MFQKSEKEVLREEFELVAPNLKMILQKKPQHMNYYEKELLTNILRKVVFMKQSFDTKSTSFIQMALHLELEPHQANEVVFNKGEAGKYFYIVLEGVYCVENENPRDHRKEKNIYYYPGDSFGEVSLIYDVPRGATIVANKDSCLLRIQKATFNSCGDLQKSIRYLNNFFQNHCYFEKEDKFMVRIVSSLSKLVSFGEKEVLVQEGQVIKEILFFVKGEAHAYKRLKVRKGQSEWEETVMMGKLTEGDVFGEKHYMSRQASGVRVVSAHRGQYIKVSFKDNISTIETPLYKRIRQNASRFPSDQDLLQQYKQYLLQKQKQLQFLLQVYKKDSSISQEYKHVKARYAKVKDARLVQ